MANELLNYFNSVKQQIIDAATQRGMLASGKTLGSLQVVETPNGYELQANSSIYVLQLKKRQSITQYTDRSAQNPDPPA